VQFDGVEYIRIWVSKVLLKKYSERERELWRAFDRVPFEKMFAAKDCAADDVLRSIKYPSYFELVKIPLPENKERILEALEADSLISKTDSGRWNITNLGAVLFASDLNNFPALGRKAVRLIQYKGNSRVETHREISDQKGYAIGFEGLIDNIKNLLPANEEIGKAFRKEVPMYPYLAIRELVANALIH
jgi:predicted HTH transcriptional regulator